MRSTRSGSRQIGLWTSFWLALFALPIAAQATTFSGSLSVGGAGADGNLIATSAWDDPNTRLSWTVDDTTTGGFWHYEYTFTVARKDISHLIIEVSDDDPGPALTADDLLWPASDPDGWFGPGGIEIALHANGVGGTGGNAWMPEDMYGVKFDAVQDELSVVLEFDSPRAPVWGDFFSKSGNDDGNKCAVWNAGFVTPDPLDPRDNGSLLDHLLVPDSNEDLGAGELLIIKYEDANENGILEDGEAMLSDWHFSITGPESRCGNTDLNGELLFSGLTPGIYTVTEILKPGWHVTTPPGDPNLTRTIHVVDGQLAILEFGNTNIPEPATVSVIGAGLALLLRRRRRR